MNDDSSRYTKMSARKLNILEEKVQVFNFNKNSEIFATGNNYVKMYFKNSLLSLANHNYFT